MTRTHFLAALLALAMAVGCKAQPASQGSPASALNRRIEIMVRSQYNVPPNISVTLGARKPGQIPGYDELPVTLSHGDKSQVIDFLISTDGKTLARLEKFDLLNDPIFSINVAGRPVRGNPAANVTVISFDDLECPYCTRMHETLFPATMEHYKGMVRFIYMDNPLMEIHPWAMHAAVNANCLAAQNSQEYWTYVDYIHSHGQEISGEDRTMAKSFDALNRIARQQATLDKLDSSALDACITRQDETPVRNTMKIAESLRIEGAPALFVEGERISGALPQDQLWIVIDRALRAAGVEPPAAPAQPAQPAQTITLPAPPS
ncbi:MAG: thioredoxin domain-containing protein [Terracidiphilus sp.]